MMVQQRTTDGRIVRCVIAIVTCIASSRYRYRTIALPLYRVIVETQQRHRHCLIATSLHRQDTKASSPSHNYIIVLLTKNAMVRCCNRKLHRSFRIPYVSALIISGLQFNDENDNEAMVRQSNQDGAKKVYVIERWCNSDDDIYCFVVNALSRYRLHYSYFQFHYYGRNH